jgi:stage II sporulation protein AA (anti-sigma F factor antagonist)
MATPKDFQVTTSMGEDDTVLIAVRGELDIATAKQLEGPFKLAISDRRPLVLDLSECPFIDSTGLRLVLRTHQELSGEEPRQPMAVVVHANLRKMFSITAIDLSVRVCDTREEAIDWLDSIRNGQAAAGLGGPLIDPAPSG